MFTGIIERVGRVERLERSESGRLVISVRTEFNRD